MAVEFQVTNPLDNSVKTLNLAAHPSEGIKARHERDLPFYNKDSERETVAQLLGIDYPKQESLRRSPEFADEVDTYIESQDGLQDNEETRKRLGVMPAERKSRGAQAGSGGLTKGQVAQIGQQFVDIIKDVTEPLATDETQLTHDYITNILNNHVEVTGELEPLPLKPTRKSGGADTEEGIKSKIAKLQAKLAELGVETEGDDEDEDDDSDELF